jgi:hypothetical protein
MKRPSLLSSPFLSALSLLPFVVAIGLGCGGKVVVDAGGAGGEGGGGSSTSTSSSTATSTATATSTSSGTGVDCGLLAQAYEQALAAATQCNACIDFDGCMQGPVFSDTCGCPIVLDSSKQDLIAAAKTANGVWLGAGCQPFVCGKPCFAGTSWSCQTNGDGTCDGTCQPN